MLRRALNAVALGLGIAGTPSLGESQNRNLPGPETPRLLVVVFQSPTRALGVEVADAVRQRFTSQMNPRQLYIIPREQMVNFLESSGYKADSSLGSTDLKELAKGLRADDLIGGEVRKTASGAFHIEPRMLLAVDPSVGQPLPVIETGSLNDAARQVERSAMDARKQLPDERACKNHIRSALDQNSVVVNPGAIDKAIAAANAGIQKYANAVIARLCLANAFQANNMPDSVIRITDEIRKLDPKSSLAMKFAVQAYKDKADAERDTVKSQQYREQTVRLLVALLAIEPFNQSLQGQVISELAKLGQPAKAIPIVDELLRQNPGDPPMLRTRWQLMMADAAVADGASKPGKLERALVAGEEMVKADTTLGDSTYYFRQVAAAMQTTPQKGVEWTTRAVQKYPTNQDFWWYKARQERSAGQIQGASQSLSRLLVLNAKYPSATVMLGQLYLDQKMNDSAIAVARRAVDAGEPKATWGQFLLAPTQAAYQKAAASDSIARADTLNAAKRAQATADYEATLSLAQEADKMNSTPQAYFFVGVSSFQIGLAAVNGAQASGAASVPSTKGTPSRQQRQTQAAARAMACELAKRATEMMLLAMTNMPRGGSVSPPTAQQILGFAPQVSAAAEQMTNAYCGPAPR
ncbi:MAG: hypothetical protein AABZ80_06730 [Gemmatimonadota bacterium]